MVARRKYTKEFKLDAVSLVLEQGYSRTEAARSLEINAKVNGTLPFMLDQSTYAC